MIKVSPGNKVVVYRKTEPEGWNDKWVDDMDSFLGKVCTVIEKNEFGICCVFGIKSYNFHPSSLKHYKGN